ncbi:hypothetical protein BCR39DRAFT_555744 [Naematelia encephala]|uniref:Uncharacterized protein n=1 Tax=Naematelia encephala TaxID=71784 RepID=A0A1Y2BLF0_9TREE|nr:hypothetical protein BCR39DRAFT_555744 [Naematelia encephala]
MGFFSKLRSSSNTDRTTPASPSNGSPKSQPAPTSTSSPLRSPPDVRPRSPSSSSVKSKASQRLWRRKDKSAGEVRDGGGQGKRLTAIYLGTQAQRFDSTPPTPGSSNTWSRRAASMSTPALAGPLPSHPRQTSMSPPSSFATHRFPGPSRAASSPHSDSSPPAQVVTRGELLKRLINEDPDGTQSQDWRAPGSGKGYAGGVFNTDLDATSFRQIGRRAISEAGHGSLSTEDLSPPAPRRSLGERDDEEMLESPEKKRFWKGVGRTRRMSKAMSESGDEPRSGSPTPRKAVPISVSTDPGSPTKSHFPTEVAQTRPPQLRRPSSSLFANPFHRSTSRASLVHDIEVQPGTDDGSFRLKAFRHISGMSDVEGAGGLEGYLSHVKRESTTILPGSVEVTSPTTTSIPWTGRISRPPSVAASLASLDDAINSSNRVSVAAFRKKIRRPSEGPLRDDEDDDVPLGMLSRGPNALRSQSYSSMGSLRAADTSGSTRPSPTHSPAPSPAARSALTPSPASAPLPTKTPDPEENSSSRSPDHSPGLQFTVGRQKAHARAGSGGFVVKGRSLFTSEPKELGQDVESQVASPSASASRDEGYFSQLAPMQSSVQVSAPQIGPSAPDDHHSTERTARIPPLVEPLNLPQAGDKTPGSLNLPLPPDQMPDTPPKASQGLPSPVTSPGNKRLSLLEDPLKVISNFWASQPEPEDKDDAFDPGLIARSMTLLAEDKPLPEPRLTPPPGPDTGLRPISRATLFDATTPSDDLERPPLSVRLQNAASQSSLHKPSVESLKMQAGADQIKLDAIQSSFSRAAKPRSSRSSMGHTVPPMVPTKDTSSEDEDVGSHRTGSRRMPGGPRRQRITSRLSAVSQPTKRGSSDESESDDESLTVLRAKASRSSLVQPVPSHKSPALPRVPTQSPRPPLVSFSVPDVRPTIGSRTSSRPGMTKSKSPARSLINLPLDARGKVLSHSPASSHSGMTSDSLGGNPMTPRSSMGPRGSGDSGGGSRMSEVGNTQPWTMPPTVRPQPTGSSLHEPRQSRISMASTSTWHPTQQPTLDPLQMQMGMPAAPMGYPMPMPMDPGMGLFDPRAMHAMMKQAWQAQYMAAAYRASEDEWERQSNASGPPAAPIVHPHAPFPYPQMPMPMFPQAMYGYPGPPSQHSGAPYYPPTFPIPPQQTGGMYSYGHPVAQSAFGGEFGPPAYLRGRPTPGDIDIATTTPQRPTHRKKGSDSPPSSWRADETATTMTPRSRAVSGQMRPPTQYAN